MKLTAHQLRERARLAKRLAEYCWGAGQRDHSRNLRRNAGMMNCRARRLELNQEKSR